MENDMIFIKSMDKKLLLDTGSPISFGDIGSVELGGKTHRLNWNPLLGEIRKCLGQGVSGLVGMDVLNQYNMVLSPDGSGYLQPEITEGDICYCFKDEKSGQIDTFLGVPVVTIDVMGAGHRFFVDTGAGITYIKNKLSSALNKTGFIEDFYPVYGNFKADVYVFQASVLGYQFTVNAGILPEFLEAMFPGEIDGVLGRDVLKQFTICLGFKSGKYYLKR